MGNVTEQGRHAASSVELFMKWNITRYEMMHSYKYEAIKPPSISCWVYGMTIACKTINIKN